MIYNTHLCNTTASISSYQKFEIVSYNIPLINFSTVFFKRPCSVSLNFELVASDGHLLRRFKNDNKIKNKIQASFMFKVQVQNIKSLLSFYDCCLAVHKINPVPCCFMVKEQLMFLCHHQYLLQVMFFSIELTNCIITSQSYPLYLKIAYSILFDVK